jgi:hypothetical protein
MTIQLVLPPEIQKQIVDQVCQQLAATIERPSASIQVDYTPTRRLTVNQACEHLGISRSTLIKRCKSGEVKRRFTAGNKPYFLLGELDGAEVVGVGGKSRANVKV